MLQTALLSGLREELHGAQKALTALQEKAVAEKRDYTETEKTEIDAKIEAIKSLNDRIDREARISAAVADAVKPAFDFTAPGPRQEVDRPTEKGEIFTKLFMSVAAGKGNVDYAANYADKVLKDKMVLKALSVGTGTAGGFVVPDPISADFIELLRDATVIRRAGARVVPMEATLTIPGQAAGTTATWVGENTAVNAQDISFNALKLTAKKLMAVSSVTRELLQFADRNVQALIQNDLVAAVARAEDDAFLAGLGTAYTPRGIYYAMASANKFNANATVNEANVTADIAKAIRLVKKAKKGVGIQNGVWITNPTVENYLGFLRNATTGVYSFPTVQSGSLFGYPILTTTALVDNAGSGNNESKIYFVDAADCVIGAVKGVTIESTSEGSFQVGGSLVSAFANDLVAMKITMMTDFGMRYDVSASVIEAAKWTF